ncbi:hypothetical protein [Celeribacter litoreus]|uniref:hypothetical protein n=1 Tax=Celeribacter litoreus TaxID=2876714 RepID=UPI001CCE750A|nr:hypothetical protein [Celeribacter litoreus]
MQDETGLEVAERDVVPNEFGRDLEQRRTFVEVFMCVFCDWHLVLGSKNSLDNMRVSRLLEVVCICVQKPN